MIREAIRKVVEGQDLTEREAVQAMTEIMEGEATSAQVASFVTAMRMKGETVKEITGFVRVMRAKAVKVRPQSTDLLDTCGTGGDKLDTFNISTTAAFVVAGAGLPVAKHGNRSVSSACGSADVLEALGVNINLQPEQVSACIASTGIGFLFAPAFHSAMKHAIGPRKELGIRTIFNMLGPLTNPAGAHVQVLGVYDASLTEPVAHVLGRLGVREAFVVHGLDHIDEMSISGPTRVSHLKAGAVRTTLVQPGDVGLASTDRAAISGGNAVTNARITLNVLQGHPGAQRDVVLLNSAAALYVAGAAMSLGDGVRLAAQAIDSGNAMRSLNALRDYTTNCAVA
jgi:anthranilate phosphoribosyltransferase